MRQAEPKLAVSDEQYPSLRPCGQGEIARVAARPTTSDSAGLCNPVVHDYDCSHEFLHAPKIAEVPLSKLADSVFSAGFDGHHFQEVDSEQ